MNLAGHPPPLRPGELRGQRGFSSRSCSASPGGPKSPIFKPAAGQAAPRGECSSLKMGFIPSTLQVEFVPLHLQSELPPGFQLRVCGDFWDSGKRHRGKDARC